MVTDIKQAAQLYADAWSRLDFTEFFASLHDDCHYSSQYVFLDLDSKDKIVEYLTDKIAAVKQIRNKVVARLATLISGATVFPRPGESCVAMYQFGSDDVTAVVFFEISGGQIKSFSLCMPELYKVSVD